MDPPFQSMRPKIFIVTDEPFELASVTHVIASAGHFVEKFDHHAGLLSRIDACTRGCIVIEMNSPRSTGLELQSALIDRALQLPMLFISGNADIPTVVMAMKKGALDFLTKPIDRDELLAAVETALRVDERTAPKRAAIHDARRLWASLSPSERKVCRLVATGLVNKQIAAQLGVTPATAHAQRTSGMKKLGIDDIVSLARLLDLVGDAS